MMLRSGISAVLFGALAECSHAISAKLAISHLAEGSDGLDWTDGKELDFDELAGFDVKEADEDTIAKAMSSHKSNQHVIVDLDSAGGMKLVTERGASVLEDTGHDESVTLSPTARAQAHAAKFEKEFTVTINMTRAHETGMALGVVLDFDTDYNPVQIFRVRKNGLIEEWNRAHPGEDVHVGDEIIQVNNIQWHANTPTFVKRMTGQFKAGRDEMPGAKDTLTWHVQRPYRQSQTRFLAQREDAHHKAYPVEFDTEVPLPVVDDVVSMNEVMGWQLAAKDDWEPVSIGNILQVGSLATYNMRCQERGYPERVIRPGDEIVKVNNVSWHHSANTFKIRIGQQIQASRRAASGLVLSIRRPRYGPYGTYKSKEEEWEAEDRALAAPAGAAGDGKNHTAAAENHTAAAAAAGAAGDDNDDVIGASEDEGEEDTKPPPEEEARPAPEAERTASSDGKVLPTLGQQAAEPPSSGGRLEDAKDAADDAAEGVAAAASAMKAARAWAKMSQESREAMSNMGSRAWAKISQEALRVEEAAAQQAALAH